MSRPGPSWRKPPPSLHLACFGCMAMLLAGCGDAGDQSPKAETNVEPPTIEAAVLTVEPQPWPTIVRSQGSLVADEVAVIGSKVAGRVDAVHVDLGDSIRAGEPLATLEQSEFRLQVAQAEAQLAQARSAVGLVEDDSVAELDPRESPPVRQERAVWEQARSTAERGGQLRASNSITQSEYDRMLAEARVAEARHAAALNAVHEKIALIGVREAELALARDRLDNTVIHAPFDGLVQSRDVAPGVYVQVGQSIATVVRPDVLRFRGAISERHAQRLAIGQDVVLRIESLAEPRSVKVTRVSPALDLRSRSLLFEAAVSNPRRALRTGLFAEAEIVIDRDARAVVIPNSALIEFAGAEKVWVLHDGVAAEKEVLAGRRRGGAIEIIQGLSPGDRILNDASRGMVARIKPLPPSGAIQADVAAIPPASGASDEGKAVAGGSGSQ